MAQLLGVLGPLLRYLLLTYTFLKRSFCRESVVVGLNTFASVSKCIGDRDSRVACLFCATALCTIPVLHTTAVRNHLRRLGAPVPMTIVHSILIMTSSLFSVYLVLYNVDERPKEHYMCVLVTIAADLASTALGFPAAVIADSDLADIYSISLPVPVVLAFLLLILVNAQGFPFGSTLFGISEMIYIGVYYLTQRHTALNV